MPTRLGKYEIQGELGSGAMGVVYRAEDPRLGRLVALKTTNAEVAGNPSLLKRFYREAQAAAKLTHPNIVTIYEIDEANGIPFIAMEFLEGDNLQKMISDRKEVPVLKKLQIIIDTCKGLEYAHQHGIVHRDMKPGNIVVSNNGQVKIVDFGIARVGVSSMTQTGVVLGTVKYMSPEQVQGQTVDARTDVFSLGIVLYELLTYETPFPGEDVPAILFKIINEPCQPITKYIPKCPPQLQQVVERALTKDREQRYQSAEDMAFDLQRIADGLRRETIDVHLQQGQGSLQAGDLTVAKESLQRVLEIDSSHQLAKSLLAEVRQRIQARQREEGVESHLRQAKEALEAEQYEDAIGALDEVLRLDSKHQEALKRRKIAVEKRDRAANIRRHLERAENLAGQTDFQHAKEELEAVLAVDERNTSALTMLGWVTKELAEQERLRHVRQFLEGGRAQLAEKNFTKALELLDRARELDALNIEVEALTRLVRSGQEKEERRKLLAKRVADIEENLGKGQLDVALASAETALHEFEDDPQILRLHAQLLRRVEANKKRSYVDEQLQAARDFVQKNQFSSALAILEQAIQAVPDDPRLPQFLKVVQESHEQTTKEDSCRNAIHQANEQIHSQNFAGAIEILERNLKQAGPSPEVADLLQFARERQAEQQRQEGAQPVLARAQSLLREQQYDEAEGILKRADEELKSNAIKELLATVLSQKADFERQRNELIANAQRLIGAGDAAKAVALFEAAPKAYFKNDQFQRVYAQCRQGLDRANFVRTAAEQINKSLREGDLSAAQSLLDQALKPYPEEPTLLPLRKRLAEERARLQREQHVKVLEEAQVALGRMKYKQVVELLNAVDWQASGYTDLAEQAKTLIEEAQQRQRKAAAAHVDLRIPAKQTKAAVTPAQAPAAAAKMPRMLVGAIAAVLVLVLAGGIVWYLMTSNNPGLVQLTAAPWGEVTGVSDAKGQHLNITGQTPLQLTLRPGRYVIEMKNGSTTGKVEVTVERGKVATVSYTFPAVKIDDLVQKIVSQY